MVCWLPKIGQDLIFLQAGRDTPGCESDPTAVPECCMLQKTPLVFLEEESFKCSSALLTEKVTLGTLVCYGLPRGGNASAALSPFGVEVVFFLNQIEAVLLYSELRAPALGNSFLVGH